MRLRQPDPRKVAPQSASHSSPKICDLRSQILPPTSLRLSIEPWGPFFLAPTSSMLRYSAGVQKPASRARKPGNTTVLDSYGEVKAGLKRPIEFQQAAPRCYRTEGREGAEQDRGPVTLLHGLG